MLEKVVRRNTVSLVSVVISFSMNWLWREESEEEGKKRGRRGEEEGKKRGRRGEEEGKKRGRRGEEEGKKRGRSHWL